MPAGETKSEIVLLLLFLFMLAHENNMSNKVEDAEYEIVE